MYVPLKVLTLTVPTVDYKDDSQPVHQAIGRTEKSHVKSTHTFEPAGLWGWGKPGGGGGGGGPIDVKQHIFHPIGFCCCYGFHLSSNTL